MAAAAYASEEARAARLSGYQLAAAGEGRRVQQSGSLTGAIWALAPRSRERDRLAAGLSRARAGRMASAYQALFSRLARQHQVTIVAGSIVLPRPEVAGGAVRAVQGPLQSVCAVFGPDDRAPGEIVRKAVPARSEQPLFAGAVFVGLA